MTSGASRWWAPEAWATALGRSLLCHTACMDGGWQAIEMESREVYPRVVIERCDGCSLCTHVCPVEGCITMVPL